jgi:hypothetical protein
VTSEVAVGNATALVLGADTRITVVQDGGPQQGTETRKIHVLHEDPPCALMIYGGSRFDTMPWSTLAQEYRRTTPRPQPTVRDTATQFVEWLGTTPVLARRPRPREVSPHVGLAAQALHEARLLMDDGRVQDLSEALERVIPAFEHDIATSTGLHATAVNRARVPVDDPHLAGLHLPRRVRRKLNGLAAYARAAGVGTAGGTGLVFGGYGHNEHQPSLVHVPEVRKTGDGITIGEPTVSHIAPPRDAFLHTFAQDSESRTLTYGTHGGMAAKLATAYADLITELGPGLSSADPGHALTRFFATWVNEMEQHHHRLLEAGAWMEPDQLVQLATLLITAATVGERISQGMGAQVGGCVDILVLTREPNGIRRVTSRGFGPEPLDELAPA